MKYDISLPPYQVKELSVRSGDQIRDWGNILLNPQVFYPVTRGEGVCVFVIDTAGRFDHPDLIVNNIADLNRNFSDSITDHDMNGHGTHCAGIVAAADNGMGVIGVAPAAKIVALKTLNDSGNGLYDWAVAAIRYVADLDIPYRKLISASWGGPNPKHELRDAIQYAIHRGVFFVAAAGNRGFIDGYNTIDYPGRYNEVITVASIGQTREPSQFSSAGIEVDVCAPGEDIYSTHIGGGYAEMSGTSMAAPHVAGMCALILSAFPDIVHQYGLEPFLNEGAVDLFDAGKDIRTGYGVVIADTYFEKLGTPIPPAPEPGSENSGCLDFLRLFQKLHK